MKKIGIIFAMQEELDALKKYLKLENEYTIFDLTFFEGTIYDKNCILVSSGIGKVNAARTTQILIDNMQVDYIFNIGVAGGIDSRLNVGDIVIGDKLVEHDFDLTAFGRPKGFIPNLEDTFIKSDEMLLSLAKEVMENKNINYYVGPIASGDIFCTSIKMSEKINTKFGALATEMEGASIAHVACLCHKPFLVIRSISDVINNENTITYEKFVVSSSVKVADILYSIIKHLNN